jgi:hypothetical protein
MMHRCQRERGATLVVGLIMLALITITVATAFSLSTTNLKSVGNMQFRNEAIAAANEAIEQVISAPFALNPGVSQFQVDIDRDGTTDYIVDVATPTCISAATMPTASQEGLMTDVDTPGFEAPPPTFDTLWNIRATATGSGTGTSVTVVQGVRRTNLDELSRSTYCPGP